MTNDIPVGYLIYQAQRAIHQMINQSFQKAGLPLVIEQWPVLMEVFHANGLSHQQIAEKTRKDKTTLTRLIATMERNGMVECRVDPADKRRKLVFYTSKAALCRDSIEAVLRTMNQQVLNEINSHEEEVFRKVLGQIFENLNWKFELKQKQ